MIIIKHFSKYSLYLLALKETLFDEDIDEQVLVKHLKNLFYNRANVDYIKFISKTLVTLSHLYSILDKGLFSPQLPVTYYFLIR